MPPIDSPVVEAQQEVIDQVEETLVDDDDGDIAGLIDSILDPEAEDDSPAEEDAEVTEEEESEEQASSDDESEDGQQAPPEEDDSEVAKLRAQVNQFQSFFGEQLSKSQRAEQERKQRELEAGLQKRLDRLGDIDDDDLRAKERGSILNDVRNQERSIFLPRIASLEEETERKAQGIVAVHYATQETLRDILAGEIDVSDKNITYEKLMDQVRERAISFMEFDSPESLESNLAEKRKFKEQQSAKVTKLEKENANLRNKLAAIGELKSGADRTGGTGGGNRTIDSKPKDDGSLESLIEGLSYLDMDETG